MIRACAFVAILAALSLGQSVKLTPSHERIDHVEVPGKRVALASLQGATLFTSSSFKRNRSVDLLVHFHGAAWLVERHISVSSPQTLLITVQVGAGSSAYGRPFSDPELFARLAREASKEIGLIGEWKSITVSGFSAGYGAIRAILRQRENYKRVSDVLLLDGIHASFEPEGKGLLDGGVVAGRDLDSFVAFAKDAVEGRKRFVVTHSEIVPPNYASTTECVNYLLEKVALKRRPKVHPGPMGMRQMTFARKGKFKVFGYNGETASDHVDFLHAMPFWFQYLDID